MRRRWIVAAVMLLLLAGACLSSLYTAVPLPQAGTVNAADLGMMLLDIAEGVSVLAVQDESMAEHAGIRPSDLLLQMNGTPFTTADELETLLHAATEFPIRLHILRSGCEMAIHIPME